MDAYEIMETVETLNMGSLPHWCSEHGVGYILGTTEGAGYYLPTTCPLVLIHSADRRVEHAYFAFTVIANGTEACGGTISRSYAPMAKKVLA